MTSDQAHLWFAAAMEEEQRYARFEYQEPANRHYWRERRWAMITRATRFAEQHHPSECSQCQRKET